MNYFTHTVNDTICKWLLDNKFPLIKCTRNDQHEELYYTLPHEDPNWQYCVAYYKPTYFDVKEWLYKTYNIFISSSMYPSGKCSVQIMHNLNKTNFFGNCWEIGYDCKTFEDCLKSAIEYIIENNILNEKSTE